MSRVLAWSLCGLTVALAAGSGILSARYAGTDWGAILPKGVEPSGETGLVTALGVTWLIAFAVIGAVVASRQPRHPMGWILGAVPAALSLNLAGEAVYFEAARIHDAEPGRAADLCLWLANWSWVPAVVLVLTFVPLLFPSGRPPSPRWRPVAWAAAAGGVLLTIGTAFSSGPLNTYDWVDNPLGASWMPSWPSAVGLVLWPLASLAAIFSVAVRYRRSHGVEREQLKWFAAAAVLLVVSFLLAATLTPVLGSNGDWQGSIIALGLLAVAIAVAIAILRHRLYDIDVVINRALVYGALTATLAATYLALVLLIGLAVGRSGFAVAVSTLAVAGLFGPARARVQGAVDRRFYRRKYDAQRTLETFTARLRDEVALDAIDSELRGAVTSTMQPAHVSLWLRPS